VEKPSRLIIGMSGASGVIYGVRLLEALRRLAVETHLVMTRAAKLTLAHETDLAFGQVRGLASTYHPVGALDAPIASGSFPADGMIVAPCSIRCLSAIATGITSDLLTRAADVTLKEGRRLVLMVRETPLHRGHLRSMLAALELGAIVAPPMPAFYARPATLDDLIAHTVGRVLDLFGLDTGEVKRWGERAPVPRGRVRRLAADELD
jgi:4-hydroxy-3-polyprenylbenzoate decarboxylase